MKRSGGCLCGAVRYEATLSSEASACHCSMCRRWSGGLFMAVGAKDIAWSGETEPTVFVSSAWAERGHCAACGSALFYRMTAGKFAGITSVSLGTLDDASGIEIAREFFIDRKPEAYALSGERPRLTTAQLEAMFGGGEALDG